MSKAVEIRKPMETDFKRIMEKLHSMLGFVHCGTIYVREDRSPRLAYEKTERNSAVF